MKALTNFIGGLAGAVALTLLHETVRHFDPDAPRVDLVGEQGVSKVMEGAGTEPLTGNALYSAAISADLLSNALYYSMIGNGKKKFLLVRGAACGLTAGVGALTLTRRMGLNDDPVNRTTRTKVMTVGYYLFGGLVAAMTIKALRRSLD